MSQMSESWVHMNNSEEMRGAMTHKARELDDSRVCAIGGSEFNESCHV